MFNRSQVAALRSKVCARLGLSPESSNEVIFAVLDDRLKKPAALTEDQLYALAFGDAPAPDRYAGLSAAEVGLYKNAWAD